MAVRHALTAGAFGLAAIVVVVALRPRAPLAQAGVRPSPPASVETGNAPSPTSLAASEEAVRAIEPAVAVAGAAANARTSHSVERLTADILEAFASLSIGRLDDALTRLLPALLLEDAPAAARLAESVTEPNLRSEVMHLVARGWGEKNTAGALAWAGGLKVEYEREAALADAAAGLARENPEQAFQLTARSLGANEPSLALESLAHRWAEKDFPAALAWTLASSAGAQREQLLARLAFVESRGDARTAALLVTERMKPGETQNEAVIAVLHQWAPRDLPGALAWVDRFPESVLRERAIAELHAIARFRMSSPAR
ncbi:MAG TPA: hypothetical protein VHO24_21205 [Opitutaceae bacterium]|nr:hypothetical protein [Opitutaceae bacterium]